MRHAPDGLQCQDRAPRALGDETRDRLRHNPPLLRPRPAFDQHVQIQLPGGQSFQRGLADGAEVPLVDILQESFFQVLVTQLAGIEIA